MSEEETIKSFKLLMYNAKANWDYFSYEILFNFFSLYNNAIEENKKLKSIKVYEQTKYIGISNIKDVKKVMKAITEESNKYILKSKIEKLLEDNYEKF